MHEPSLHELPPGLRTPPRTEPFWLALLVLGVLAVVVLLAGPAHGDFLMALEVLLPVGYLAFVAIAAVVSFVQRRRRRGTR